MGVVFFLGFALLAGFIGLIFLAAGFLFFKKHRIISITSFVFSGALFIPIIFTIVILCLGISDSKQYDKKYIEDNGQLNYEIFKGHEKKAIKLVEKGADLNRLTASGHTPLMEACIHNQKDLVQKLLEKGADPNLATEKQPPAIFHFNNIISTRLLIEHGAELNALDNDGNTPLVYFIKRIIHFHNYSKDTVILLLKNGADPRIQDKNGKNFIDYLNEHLMQHGNNSDEQEYSCNKYILEIMENIPEE